MPAKWERIAHDLRKAIKEGKYEPGEQLPTAAALVEEYDASPPVVRQAMQALKSEGLTVTRHGLGTFVRTLRQKATRRPDRYHWEKARVHQATEERLQSGATERDTGLTFADLRFHAEYEEVAAPDEIAELFDVEPGTLMLMRKYRTQSKHEDAPVSLINSYLVHAVVAQNPDLLNAANEPWPGGTMHQLSTIGIEIDRITDRIRTRPPSREEAEQLGIDPEGDSVFLLRKISRDRSGQVVELSDLILPGDRTEFEYETLLAPWETA